ncbi:MAG: 50S ribosomal protein L18 [Acidimicrobiia bacterium]|nr:50S ribosomal protein L18 [Acidimicrobiia bacterium]
MANAARKRQARLRRHRRIRKKITGTALRPRLAVHRSNKHIQAQVIDDVAGRTLVSASSVEPALRATSGANVAGATEVGKVLAERATEAGIRQVVFDRGGFLFHGRVAALAEAAREGGLEF